MKPKRNRRYPRRNRHQSRTDLLLLSIAMFAVAFGLTGILISINGW